MSLFLCFNLLFSVVQLWNYTKTIIPLRLREYCQIIPLTIWRIIVNPLTSGAFCDKGVSWKFWWFLGWISAQLALIWSKMHLHHDIWAFLCISQAPFGRSLWSGHYWKDLLLLQKLSIDDANFGQKWWRQKWKKGQGSSWPVTASMGVNGLNIRISELAKYTTMLQRRAGEKYGRKMVQHNWNS